MPNFFVTVIGSLLSQKYSASRLCQDGERLSIPGMHSIISTAEAVVGRPLTPVSVAGVARRSVRRCAVGPLGITAALFIAAIQQAIAKWTAARQARVQDAG